MAVSDLMVENSSFRSISMAGPSSEDEEESKTLIEYIVSADIYEDVSDRDGIVKSLSEMLWEWMDEYKKEKGITDVPDGIDSGACIKLFGGHTFGVVTKGGDMDLVAIVPKHVNRSDFFRSFPTRLQRDPHISTLRVITGAYVPIIKFQYKDIEVDLCLSVLSCHVIPEGLDLQSDDILKDIDDLSIRSLSGVRENDVIWSLVPDTVTFCMTLKVIKHWAKCKGIHHYPMGFLGGIAWAIMVAKVQQMFPNAAVSTLVYKFFRTYLAWPWPTPVLLHPLQENSLKLPQWNPQVSTSDARHPMAVITPAYPEHNATFTATASTIRILQTQLAAACEVTDKIKRGEELWGRLFEKLNLQKMYKHFLVLTAMASSSQGLLNWAGLVESRIRLLVQSLEKQPAIALVHPNTSSTTSTQETATGTLYLRRWMLGLELCVSHGTHLNVVTDIKNFKDTVHTLALERHIHDSTMSLDIRHVKRKQLSELFNIPA